MKAKGKPKKRAQRKVRQEPIDLLRITDAGRYAYWRTHGVALSDAPVSYAYGKELDQETDALIVEEWKAARKHK